MALSVARYQNGLFMTAFDSMISSCRQSSTRVRARRRKKGLSSSQSFNEAWPSCIGMLQLTLSIEFSYPIERHGHECLLHEGAMVEKGVKYVLRSDVMFVD